MRDARSAGNSEAVAFPIAIQASTSPRDIAAALYVEPSTVKTHVAHALTKLGLPDRVAAVIYAYERGVVVPRDTG